MTAQGPCPAPPAAHLGTRPGHVVQPLARLWLPHPRYAVAGHLRAHGDAPALRLHRAPARPIAAGALWKGTERADGGGGQARRLARTVLALILRGIGRGARLASACLLALALFAPGG